jgi:hypothetical protein
MRAHHRGLEAKLLEEIGNMLAETRRELLAGRRR